MPSDDELERIRIVDAEMMRQAEANRREGLEAAGEHLNTPIGGRSPIQRFVEAHTPMNTEAAQTGRFTQPTAPATPGLEQDRLFEEEMQALRARAESTTENLQMLLQNGSISQNEFDRQMRRLVAPDFEAALADIRRGTGRAPTREEILALPQSEYTALTQTLIEIETERQEGLYESTGITAQIMARGRLTHEELVALMQGQPPPPRPTLWDHLDEED